MSWAPPLFIELAHGGILGAKGHAGVSALLEDGCAGDVAVRFQRGAGNTEDGGCGFACTLMPLPQCHASIQRMRWLFETPAILMVGSGTGGRSRGLYNKVDSTNASRHGWNVVKPEPLDESHGESVRIKVDERQEGRSSTSGPTQMIGSAQ